MTEPTTPSVPGTPVEATTPDAEAKTDPTPSEGRPEAKTLETPVTERTAPIVVDAPATAPVSATAPVADPKVEPMTRESALESKEPDKKSAEPQPSDLWGVLRAILSTPWGRRSALIIVGIVLFFVGYVSGRWGRSDLEGQLADRRSEIVQYKKKLSAGAAELDNVVRERDQLQLRLRESEEKREFFRQRDKIRKYVADSRKAWEARNVKEALEALHKANIHFQSEARAAKGVSAYMYRTIARRIQQALTAMETDCADTKGAPMSAFEVPVAPVVSCLERVNTLLQQVLDALPPARED